MFLSIAVKVHHYLEISKKKQKESEEYGTFATLTVLGKELNKYSPLRSDFSQLPEDKISPIPLVWISPFFFLP